MRYRNLFIDFLIILSILIMLVVIRLSLGKYWQRNLDKQSAQQKENWDRHKETFTQQKELTEFANKQRELCGEY